MPSDRYGCTDVALLYTLHDTFDPLTTLEGQKCMKRSTNEILRLETEMQT